MVSEDREKVKELKWIIDELFSLYWKEDEDDDFDAEFLIFEIKDVLDFMEDDCVEKEEILKLVRMAAEASREEIPKIFYQLHTQVEKLETCIAANSQEGEATDGDKDSSNVNKVNVSNFSTIDFSRIDALVR